MPLWVATPCDVESFHRLVKFSRHKNRKKIFILFALKASICNLQAKTAFISASFDIENC
jgi:hypothetical protein